MNVLSLAVKVNSREGARVQTKVIAGSVMEILLSTSHATGENARVNIMNYVIKSVR